MRVDINPRYESLGARIYRAAYPDGDDFIPTIYPSPKPAASPELRAALDTVPGWREVIDKLRWLLTTAAAYTPPPAVDNGRLFGGVDSDPGAPRRAILAGVDARKLDLAAIRQARIDAAQAALKINGTHVDNLFQQDVADAAGALLSERAALIAAAVDDLLAHLNGQLGKLVKSARGGTSQSAAYARIRAAQRLIVDSSGYTAWGLNEAGMIADTDTHWDSMPAYRKAMGGDPVMIDRRPYPAPGAESDDWYRWIIANPSCEPWVPTRPELDARLAELAEIGGNCSLQNAMKNVA